MEIFTRALGHILCVVAFYMFTCTSVSPSACVFQLSSMLMIGIIFVDTDDMLDKLNLMVSHYTGFSTQLFAMVTLLHFV